MKKRFLSVLTALALCLTPLPAAALAAGTAPSYVTLAGTELQSDKFYIPKTDGGIKETTDSPDTNYLTYDGGVLTVNGTVEVSGSAGLNFDDGTLTLAGDGDLTITASGINSAVSGSNGSTLTTEGFSGSITLQSVNGDAVQLVKLDLTTRGDIRISSAKIAVNTPDNPVTLKGETVTIETTANPADDATVIAPSLNVTAGGNVTIIGSGNTYPLIGDGDENCAVTLNAGGNVEIVNKSGTAVHGPLTVAKAVDVAISGNGNTLFSSASITASGTVQMESSGSNGVVYSGAANGLTITGAKKVDIAGETSSDPVVTGMTLKNCGTASVTRLGNPDSEAPIANTVTSDIPVLLHNGANDNEPRLLWKNFTYQKADTTVRPDMAPTHTKAVYYEAGNGYVMFSQLSNSDPTNGAASAILFNAESKDKRIEGNLTEIEVVGENVLEGINVLKLEGESVSVTGTGTLNTSITSTVSPKMAGGVTFNGLVCVNKEGTIENPTASLDFTAYGNSELPPIMPGGDKFVVGAVSNDKVNMLVSLTVQKGATLTIPKGVTLEISGLEYLSRLTNNGTLVNNSTVFIPDATAENIKGLRLTGSGLVQVPAGTGYTYYTNEGAALGNLKVENLDLSQVVGDQGDLETDGYHWDNTDRTLTLNGLAVTGALDLPNGAEDIKIAVQKESFVNSLSHPDSYRPTVRIVGREPLTVQHMSGDIHLTLERDGALNAGEINIGAVGNKDSIITVNGKLTVKGSEGSEGIRCGQMVIGATGVLNVSGEQGVAVFGVNGSSDRYQGAFQIAKGGTFTANCTDYNVMVLTQGITMDEAKAKTYLVLPENYLPEGYSIQVATGDNDSDKVYAATVAKKGATLTLIAKRVDGAGGQLELKFQTAPKPGAGGGSAGGSTGGGSSSSSRPSTSTGTTTKPDGTKVQTETKADGTKIQTETKEDGSTVKTTTNPNGSSVTETKAADGSTGTVKTDKNGQTTAETTLSSKAIEDAKKNGEAVTAPVQVEATRDSSTAPTVKVELPKNAGETEVEIPVSNAKPGTVAVLVHPDGTEEILKASVSTENGIRLTVDGSATVKIVDNSKDFIDTRNHWAKDAIDFVSARELVNGMNDSIYAPNNSTTRAQLWTILARQNDADLNGGNTWYEKAQLWSKDKGISDGTQPDAAINRAQMVTMLWRTMGQPAAGGAANFTDVPANSYYAQAVAWAVENGITAGVGGGRFDPNSTCTRAQIATFLYRYMK